MFQIILATLNSHIHWQKRQMHVKILWKYLDNNIITEKNIHLFLGLSYTSKSAKGMLTTPRNSSTPIKLWCRAVSTISATLPCFGICLKLQKTDPTLKKKRAKLTAGKKTHTQQFSRGGGGGGGGRRWQQQQRYKFIRL